MRQFWSVWGEVVVLVGAIVASSVLAWRFPGPIQVRCTAAVFAIGLVFDVLSAFYTSLGLVTRRHVSGFPLIGMVFYTWAWLSLPAAILFAAPGGLAVLWLCKLADLAALAGFHLLFHAPFWVLGPFFPPVHPEAGKDAG